jgi:hypothetical protein
MKHMEALEKIFADTPGTSTIVITCKCEDCGCELTVDVTATPEGFGLQSGVLLAGGANGFLAQCLDCHQVNPKMPNSYASTS